MCWSGNIFWGTPLHWTVAPIAFIALIAVGADYNLLLALRINEEARAGFSTGMIRAFAGTGGVVTTAGIVFGLTMFAMLGSRALSIAQVGIDDRRRTVGGHPVGASARRAGHRGAVGPVVLVADPDTDESG